MKRYILLAGENYYPAAWDDFKGSFWSLDRARAKAAKSHGDWYQIIDCETEKECECGRVVDLRAASEGELDD